MPKVLVLFHSRTGHTARLADAIAEGARSVRFTEVDVRRIEELAPARVDELAGYDALVVGGPAPDGVLAAEVTLLLDRLAPLGRQGALADRVGSAFTSAPPATPDGAAPTPMSILTPMCALGMILVPPGYTDPVMLAGGSPYGATAGAEGPTDADLAAARHQGKRVAKVAEWVRHAKGHEGGHGHGHAHGHHHH